MKRTALPMSWKPLLRSVVLMALTALATFPVEVSPVSVNSILPPVYFTDPLNPDSIDFEQRLIDFIGSASATLDAAVYEIDSTPVLEALERACVRGVVVRLVTQIPIERSAASCNEQPRPKEQGIESGYITASPPAAGNEPGKIQTVAGPDRAPGSMHHKFAVVDGVKVWTGSANWTPTGLHHNANNALALSHPEIARAYAKAFEWLFDQRQFGKRMPGVSPGPYYIGQSPNEQLRPEERGIESGDITASPQTARKRPGNENEPAKIQIYFSPNEQNETEIIRQIQSAKNSIRLAMFYYTNDRIHKAVLDAMGRGVEVDAVWGQRGVRDCVASDIDDALRLGVGIIAPLEGVLHHKFAVIDERVVITGSANWTASGVRHNDENLLMIESAQVARRFLREFERLKSDAIDYARSSQTVRWVRRHFNQLPGAVRLEWHPTRNPEVTGYVVCRFTNQQTCAPMSDRLPPTSNYFVDEHVDPAIDYRYRIGSVLPNNEIVYSAVYEATALPAIEARSVETVKATASDWYGTVVSLRLTVESVARSPNGQVTLHSDAEDGRDVSAFVPTCAVERFSNLGVDLGALAGRTVRVVGELRSYLGPELVLYDPGQLFLEDEE